MRWFKPFYDNGVTIAQMKLIHDNHQDHSHDCEYDDAWNDELNNEQYLKEFLTDDWNHWIIFRLFVLNHYECK
jgi:hypothetical protein